MKSQNTGWTRRQVLPYFWSNQPMQETAGGPWYRNCFSFLRHTQTYSQAGNCVLRFYFAGPAGGGFPDAEEDSRGHELVQSKSFVLLSLFGPYYCNGSFGLVNGVIPRHWLDHNSHPRLHPYNFPGEKQEAQSILATQITQEQASVH